MWTAIAAVAGLVFGAAGWTVVGRQAVTEKVVSDRRTAFKAVILEADRRTADPARDIAALREAVATADFVCSVSMRRSGRLERVEAQVLDGRWNQQKKAFVSVARLECIHGSAVVRIRLRRWYTDPNLDTVR